MPSVFPPFFFFSFSVSKHFSISLKLRVTVTVLSYFFSSYLVHSACLFFFFFAHWTAQEFSSNARSNEMDSIRFNWINFKLLSFHFILVRSFKVQSGWIKVTYCVCGNISTFQMYHAFNESFKLKFSHRNLEIFHFMLDVKCEF